MANIYRSLLREIEARRLPGAAPAHLAHRRCASCGSPPLAWALTHWPAGPVDRVLRPAPRNAGTVAQQAWPRRRRLGRAGGRGAAGAGRYRHRSRCSRWHGSRAGRARQADGAGQAFDNGQHILIGAYSATLDLMRSVGADPAHVAAAPAAGAGRPCRPSACGCRPAPPLPAFARAVLAAGQWPWATAWRCWAAAAGWLLRRFQCPADWTVQRCAPGCRPAGAGRADRSAVRGGAEHADGSRPARPGVPARAARRAVQRPWQRRPAAAPRALVGPAARRRPGAGWVRPRRHTAQLADRVGAAARPGARSGWQLDGEAFDQVVLACSATEAARLAAVCGTGLVSRRPRLQLRAHRHRLAA